MNWLTHDVETYLEVESFRKLFSGKSIEFLFSKEDNTLYRLYLLGNKTVIRDTINNFDKESLDIPKDYYPDRSADLNSLLCQMKYSANNAEQRKYSVGFLLKEMKRLVDRKQIISFQGPIREKRFIRKIGPMIFKDNDIKKPLISYSGLSTGITLWNYANLSDMEKLSV